MKSYKSKMILVEKINSLRNDLNHRVCNATNISEGLLEISRELDILIAKYYKKL